MTVLALATLGDVTQKGSFLLAKVSKVVFPLALFLGLKQQQQPHVTVTVVPALATLGGMTQIGSFLLAKASNVMFPLLMFLG